MKLREFYVQRKVIIGSVTGILLVLVCTVGLFFPNLFDLQKKEIPSYAVVISSSDDFPEFYKVVNENINKPFYLEITFCPTYDPNVFKEVTYVPMSREDIKNFEHSTNRNDHYGKYDPHYVFLSKEHENDETHAIDFFISGNYYTENWIEKDSLKTKKCDVKANYVKGLFFATKKHSFGQNNGFYSCEETLFQLQSISKDEYLKLYR